MDWTMNDIDENEVHTFLFRKVTGHEQIVVLKATRMDELRTLMEIMMESMTDCELISSEIDDDNLQRALDVKDTPYEFTAQFMDDSDEDTQFEEFFYVERTQPISMDLFS